MSKAVGLPVCRLRANFGRHRRNPATSARKAGRIRPNSAEFAGIRPGSSRDRPKLGRNSPNLANFGQTLADIGPSCSEVARKWPPHLAQVGSTSADIEKARDEFAQEIAHRSKHVLRCSGTLSSMARVVRPISSAPRMSTVSAHLRRDPREKGPTCMDLPEHFFQSAWRLFGARCGAPRGPRP